MIQSNKYYNAANINSKFQDIIVFNDMQVDMTDIAIYCALFKQT